MNDRFTDPGNPRDVVRIPTLWVAVALSLLIHVVALWQWLPQMRMLSLESAERGQARGSLSVQLAPPPSPSARPAPAAPTAPAAEAQPPPTRRPPPLAARPRPAPPVIALDRPAPNRAAPPPAIPAPAPPRPSADGGDLASYIDARRSARAEGAPAAASESVASTPPVEDEEARRKRIVAANLGLQRTPGFGGEPTHGGGIFDIQRMGNADAEFIFFGWNKDIRRNARQLIEVQKGDNGDIRIAVVRRMIAIIREHESGDFRWESRRLAREITLSARPVDNAGLEEFLMREFFADPRRPY